MNVKERYFNVLEDNEFDDYELKELEPLDQIILLMHLEKEFKISIDDDKAVDIFLNGTHEDFINYINELV